MESGWRQAFQSKAREEQVHAEITRKNGRVGASLGTRGRRWGEKKGPPYSRDSSRGPAGLQFFVSSPYLSGALLEMLEIYFCLPAHHNALHDPLARPRSTRRGPLELGRAEARMGATGARAAPPRTGFHSEIGKAELQTRGAEALPGREEAGRWLAGEREKRGRRRVKRLTRGPRRKAVDGVS